MKRTYIKLMVISLVQSQQKKNLPSGVIPDNGKICSIKTRKSGKTIGEKTLEDGVGYNGLILALKRNGSDVDIEIPLQSIYERSSNGDCYGYVLKTPTHFNFGETGSEIRSYNAANVTTGNVIELEIEYEL
ncbi:MAG: hypothetical protein U5L45_15875 [Saprospiraceae bacterium]|nr:hypothetical protein [Saprospiraceae bacterium]